MATSPARSSPGARPPFPASTGQLANLSPPQCSPGSPPPDGGGGALTKSNPTAHPQRVEDLGALSKAPLLLLPTAAASTQVHQVVLLSRLGSSLWGDPSSGPALTPCILSTHRPARKATHPAQSSLQIGGHTRQDPPSCSPQTQSLGGSCRKGCRCRGARARYGPGSSCGPELTCGRNAPTFPTWAGAGEASSPAPAAIRQVGHPASPSGPRSPRPAPADPHDRPTTRRAGRRARPACQPSAPYSPRRPGPHLRFQLSLKRQSPISPALTLGPSAPATRAL